MPGSAGSIGALPSEELPTEPPPETLNLAGSIAPEELAKIAERVILNYKTDRENRQKHMDRIANQIRLFSGTMKPKSWPFANCANAHLPLLSESILRLQARIYDQIIPQKGDFFHSNPTGLDDHERADRTEKHLNWQTRYEIRDYRIGLDNSIQQWLLQGSTFRRVYRDRANNRNAVDHICAEDFVVPYAYKSTDPMMSDVPRKTLVLRKARYELEAMVRSGDYISVADLFQPPSSIKPEEAGDDKVRQAVDKVEGVTEEPTRDDQDRKRILLEQHCWMVLPGALNGQKFGEELRPVVATVDLESRKVLSLYIREDDDPMDRLRYESEMQEVQQERQRRDDLYVQQIEALAQDETATPEHAAMVPRPDPAAVPDPSPVRKKAVEYFIHYYCIPNPEGFYGLGIGFLLEGHNESADTILSQIIDTGTLANTVTAIVDRLAKMSRGEIEIVPGTVKELDLGGRTFDDVFKIIQWPGPQPAMFKVVEWMKEAATGIAQAGEVVSGILPDRATATGARIQAAMALTAIAILVRRFLMSLDYEVKALARLNYIYLDDEVPFKFAVTDPNVPGGVRIVKITRRDYLQDLDIEFVADARMASQVQRIEEAQQVLSVVLSNPMTASNPPLVFAATKKLFLAMGCEDLVALMGPPPQVAMAPMGGPPPMMGQPPGGALPPMGKPGETPDTNSQEVMADVLAKPTPGQNLSPGPANPGGI